MTSPLPDTCPRRSATGFTLVEAALAIAIFGTVALGVLALLGDGLRSRGRVERDTLAAQLAQQVVESLRGFEAGRDDAKAPAPSDEPGLLDAFLPFNFSDFPPSGQRFVLGFDRNGAVQRGNFANQYEDGTTSDIVTHFVTISGKPSGVRAGLTEIVLGVETPAADPASARRRTEFRLLMVPRQSVNPNPVNPPTKP